MTTLQPTGAQAPTPTQLRVLDFRNVRPGDVHALRHADDALPIMYQHLLTGEPMHTEVGQVAQPDVQAKLQATIADLKERLVDITTSATKLFTDASDMTLRQILILLLGGPYCWWQCDVISYQVSKGFTWIWFHCYWVCFDISGNVSGGQVLGGGPVFEPPLPPLDPPPPPEGPPGTQIDPFAPARTEDPPPVVDNPDPLGLGGDGTQPPIVLIDPKDEITSWYRRMLDRVEMWKQLGGLKLSGLDVENWYRRARDFKNVYPKPPHESDAEYAARMIDYVNEDSPTNELMEIIVEEVMNENE